MERLWTPWRRAFVEGAGDGPRPDCFLCEIATHPDNDAQNFVLARSTSVFVLLNLYPYNTGHLMVAPYEHTGDLANLDSTTATDLIATTQRSVGVLGQVYGPDGFNVGLNLGRAAGAGVPDHLHVHALPRWVGDTNFMPVLANTKVLPESLEQTYERLQPHFRSS
jgi:ATP adenylyltransferase